ncbi:hypothetical protein NHP194004_15550 [Helicobacter suis]|nr:hypothetical protein NHP194004_15550 [Helicobacter suis]
MFGSYPPTLLTFMPKTPAIYYCLCPRWQAKKVSQERKEAELTQQEWVEFTKQIWDIPIPNKKRSPSS